MVERRSSLNNDLNAGKQTLQRETSMESIWWDKQKKPPKEGNSNIFYIAALL